MLDDNRMTLRLIRRQMEGEFELTLVRTLDEARKALRESDFDTILLDLLLEKGSGSDLLRDLRSDPATALTPVMVISSALDLATIWENLLLGANDWRHKPCRFSELGPELRELIARPNTRLPEKRIERIPAVRWRDREGYHAYLPQLREQISASSEAALLERIEQRIEALPFGQLQPIRPKIESFLHAPPGTV